MVAYETPLSKADENCTEHRKRSIDDIVLTQNRIPGASNRQMVGTYSQSSGQDHLPYIQPKSCYVHTVTHKAATSTLRESYDPLEPVWFDKIIERIEDDRRKQSRPLSKEQSHVCRN